MCVLPADPLAEVDISPQLVSVLYIHRYRNRRGGGAGGAMASPLFDLVSRVRVLVILHTRYAQKPAGVGGASWWV